MTNNQKPTVPAGVHRIRLAGPWALTKHENLTGQQKLNSSGDIDRSEVSEIRVTLPFDFRNHFQADAEPFDAVTESQQSTWELTRKFHRPNGLSESTVVNLLIVATWKCSEVQLNGKQLTISDCRTLNDVSLSPASSSAAKASPNSETVKTAKAAFQTRYSIQSLLRGFNELSVGLSAAAENRIQRDTPLIVISACLEILES